MASDPVSVESIELRTEGNAFVVAVSVNGKRVDVIREPWSIGPDDGSVWHVVTALGIREVADGRLV